jgi:hypothetical protein
LTWKWMNGRANENTLGYTIKWDSKNLRSWKICNFIFTIHWAWWVRWAHRPMGPTSAHPYSEAHEKKTILSKCNADSCKYMCMNCLLLEEKMGINALEGFDCPSYGLPIE